MKEDEMLFKDDVFEIIKKFLTFHFFLKKNSHNCLLQWFVIFLNLCERSNATKCET